MLWVVWRCFHKASETLQFCRKLARADIPLSPIQFFAYFKYAFQLKAMESLKPFGDLDVSCLYYCTSLCHRSVDAIKAILKMSSTHSFPRQTRARACALLGYAAVNETGLFLLATKVKPSVTMPGGHQIMLVTESQWVPIRLQVWRNVFGIWSSADSGG